MIVLVVSSDSTCVLVSEDLSVTLPLASLVAILQEIPALAPLNWPEPGVQEYWTPSRHYQVDATGNQRAALPDWTGRDLVLQHLPQIVEAWATMQQPDAAEPSGPVADFAGFLAAAKQSPVFTTAYNMSKTVVAVAQPLNFLTSALTTTGDLQAIDTYQADLIAELAAAGSPLSADEITEWETLRDQFGIR